MILSTVKFQPDGINVTEILLKSSWHTHLKYSKPYIFILQKLKNPPYGFCTPLFFASAIILIFGGLLLHRLSRILKFKINWLRVPITDYARKKFRTRRDNPNPSKLSWKKRKKPPKGHIKRDLLFSAQFQRIGYSTYSLKKWNSQNMFDLTLMSHKS